MSRSSASILQRDSISRRGLFVRVALAVICIGAGAVFLLGGGWLVALGGSAYYLLAGLMLASVGVLLFSRRREAYWAFSFLTVVTIIWALFEVGPDFWQLLPRGDLIIVIGALLLLPLSARSVAPLDGSAVFGNGYRALCASIVACCLVAGISFFRPPTDIAGDLPQRKAVLSDEGSRFGAGKDWTAYGGTPAGNRFSTLDQIDSGNISQLEVAWKFNTGDTRREGDPVETTYEVTPLKIGSTLYFCTPHDLVFALDAETGKEKWRYDPKLRTPPFKSTQHLTCRGISYFEGSAQAASSAPSDATAAECTNRLFLPTVDGRLVALSPETGQVCTAFGGPDGVDLWQNMPNVSSGSYYSTSPPVIAKNLVIIGGAVNDNVSTKAPSGVIRAFDVNTGALVWNWDSRNPTATAPILPGQKYTESSPNSWSISSYDPDLGLVYVPMGNQSPDQFGGNRDANVEKYSSSVVALNAETGQVVWVFQTVHHDLWDMDVPAQPSLVNLTIGGDTIPALVQPTKQGEVFVLNRRTGEPLLPVVERPAPQGAVKGDFTAPEQPVSAISFNPPPLTEASMWGISPIDQLACRIKFRSRRYEGRYTPPSVQGSIIYPGNAGTFNWGGVAVDPERQVMFAMPVYLAFTSKMIERPNADQRLVTNKSDPPFNENFGAPFAVQIAPFLSPLKIPCQAPPWGYVAGVDLVTGKTAYRHVNGTVRDLSPIPLPFKLGVPGMGGPLITKGGVAFLSGTMDYFVRGYDVTSGKQLWESRLPAGGQATPMTYWSDVSNRQFLIVVAGGHGTLGTKMGDSILAYALPKH